MFGETFPVPLFLTGCYLWGDYVLLLGKSAATFGETRCYLWGDGPLPLGRRPATFEETRCYLWGDFEPGDFGAIPSQLLGFLPVPFVPDNRDNY